jgi:hypothetical protein
MAIVIDVLEVFTHLLENTPLVGIRDRVLAMQGEYRVDTDKRQIKHWIHIRTEAPQPKSTITARI